MGEADFVEIGGGEEVGGVGVVGRVDVFALAEEDAVDWFEAFEEEMDAGDSRDDDGNGAVADDQVQMVFSCLWGKWKGSRLKRNQNWK